MDNDEHLLIYAIKKIGWSFAIAGNDTIKGVIVGDADYVRYVAGQFPEEKYVIYHPEVVEFDD